MAKRLTEIDLARIEHRRWVKQLETMVARMFAMMRGPWEKAPPDPGFRAGGFRERAMKGVTLRSASFYRRRED